MRIARRHLLHSAAAGAVAVPLLGQAERGENTFVLVHGGWSSGFNYHQVLERLASAGHRAVAVDLPGHGQQARFPGSYLTQDLDAFPTEPSPSADLTLAGAVGHVANVVRRITERTGGKVILLGHSSGGIVIGKVANEVPHLVARLVYTAAYLIAQRDSAFDYFDPTPYYPNARELGVLRTNWRDPAVRAMLKPGLFPLSSEETFVAFANTWQPDFPLEFLTASSRVDARVLARIPRTYVRFADDGTITPQAQSAWIAEADALAPRNRTDVHTVRGGHLDPFAAPGPLVAILRRLPEARG